MNLIKEMVKAFWANKDENATDEDRMCDAVRALAEFKPTPDMLDALNSRDKNGEYRSRSQTVKAWLLAAVEPAPQERTE